MDDWTGYYWYLLYADYSTCWPQPLLMTDGNGGGENDRYYHWYFILLFDDPRPLFYIVRKIIRIIIIIVCGKLLLLTWHWTIGILGSGVKIPRYWLTSTARLIIIIIGISGRLFMWDYGPKSLLPIID